MTKISILKMGRYGLNSGHRLIHKITIIAPSRRYYYCKFFSWGVEVGGYMAGRLSSQNVIWGPWTTERPLTVILHTGSNLKSETSRCLSTSPTNHLSAPPFLLSLPSLHPGAKQKYFNVHGCFSWKKKRIIKLTGSRDLLYYSKH